MRQMIFVLACLLLTPLSGNAVAKYVGGDISLLTKYEEHGAIYYNENGARITNMLGYLKDEGFNAMRVRLFVDPSMAGAEDQGEGVCQDLPYVMALGQRIKANTRFGTSTDDNLVIAEEMILRQQIAHRKAAGHVG